MITTYTLDTYNVIDDIKIDKRIKISLLDHAIYMLNNKKKYYKDSYYSIYYKDWRILSYKRTGTIGAIIGIQIDRKDSYVYDYDIMLKIYEDEKKIRWLLDGRFDRLPTDLHKYLIDIYFNNSIAYKNKSR